jgi:predicted DNA-binding transcriptional regulator AlpA
MNDAREDAMLRPDEAARRCGVSISTLAAWRRDHRGPRHVKMTERAIRYPARALEAWLRDRTAS